MGAIYPSYSSNLPSIQGGASIVRNIGYVPPIERRKGLEEKAGDEGLGLWRRYLLLNNGSTMSG